MREKLRKMRRQSKKGMSLIIVLISISMLVVMGTLFTTVALRSYNNSYAKMCKQQAKYTAQSSVDLLYDILQEDDEVMDNLITLLDNQIEANNIQADEVTDFTVTIGEVGGGTVTGNPNDFTQSLIDMGLFSQVMGTCKLQVRYTNTACTRMSLEAYATFKGYSEVVRMEIAKTVQGAEEIAKVMSNTFFWESPMTNVITAEIIGDVYVKQPAHYATDENGNIYGEPLDGSISIPSNYSSESTACVAVFNKVMYALITYGRFNNIECVAGQYIRNANGNIINEFSGSNTNRAIVIYNRYLRDTVYGNVETQIENNGNVLTVYGHTKPFDIDNEPVSVGGSGGIKNAEYYPDDYIGSDTIYYNDWVELYAFSDYRSGSEYYGDYRSNYNWSNDDYNNYYNGYKPSSGFSSEFDGGGSSPGTFSPNLYLYNNDTYAEAYVNYLKNGTDPYGVFTYPRNYTAINGDLYVQARALIGLWDKDANDKKNWQFYNNNTWKRDYINYYDNIGSTRFEHGYPEGVDVFFDHVNDNIPNWQTTFRINGNMYLYDDARIENFDSVNTYNAYQGIKNNIYAKKDLVIDGYVFQSGSGYNRVHKKSVSIYGDVMVQGDLYIANSVIYGDIYCNGDSLTILDSTIYGNVYFEGCELSINYSLISNGNLSFNTLSIPCPGGNVYVAGQNAKSTYLPNAGHISNTASNNAIAPVFIMNATISGTLYSRVNTEIGVAKWDGNGQEEYINNIICEGYLYMNLSHHYDYYYQYVKSDIIKNFSDYDDKKANDANKAAAQNNSILVDGVVVAYGIKLTTQQCGDYSPKWVRVKNIAVGAGGYYIDGNENKKNKILITDLSTSYGTSIEADKIWNTSLINNNVYTYSEMLGWVTGDNSGYNNSMANLKKAFAKMYFNNGSSLGLFTNSASTEMRVLENWDEYLFPTNEDVWSEREANPQSWTAPKASVDEAASVFTVFYHQMPKASTLAQSIASLDRSDVATFDNTTFTFKKSIEFDYDVTFPDRSTIIFDSYAGNIHIKFNGNVDFGDQSTVIIRGGNMSFLYIEGDIYVGNGTTIGIVEEVEGVDRRADSIYIVSDTNNTMHIGESVTINGYIYMPKGYVSIKKHDGNKTLLNGSLAVKGFILDGIVGNANATISQYKYCVYNFIPAPLITDTSISYGDVDAYGRIIWEFLGYY